MYFYTFLCKKNEELKIGWIIIKKWFPESLNNIIPVYNSSETYINWNVENYFLYENPLDILFNITFEQFFHFYLTFLIFL